MKPCLFLSQEACQRFALAAADYSGWDICLEEPTKGLLATQRFVLSAVFVYRLAILYCFLQNLDLRVGLKALLKAA